MCAYTFLWQVAHGPQHQYGGTVLPCYFAILLAYEHTSVYLVKDLLVVVLADSFALQALTEYVEREVQFPDKGTPKTALG